jgi:UDP-glucose:(heptosyl)LPS alpha-1,3-glucosyltransferase
VKVALVILHADPARGGAERYTLDLAAALAKRGHAVSVLAASFAADWPSGVAQIRLDSGGVTRAGQYKRFLDAVDTHVAGTRYDVVHAMLPVRTCDVYHPHAGLAVEKEHQTGLRLAFNYRRKVMADVERTLLAGPRPPVVLSLSEYVKRDIVRHYPDLGERLVTLFNAVDLQRFEPQPPPKSTTPTALIIANDFDRKGLPQVIRAVGRVGSTRLNLDVVGKEPPGAFDALAKDEGVADAVVFWGGVNDPRPRYAAADFFVLPTKHDPCSLVVLEALAMGLPVISTRFNGATEVMADGVHGFVLDDPADVDALADAMRKLMDPNLRARMREACLALRPALSYETHLDNLQRVYDRVVAGQAKA